VERSGDAAYSRHADWRRWVSFTEEGIHDHMTRAEWLEWAAEHMPNGYCICDPRKGIVCGQHAMRPAS